LRDDPSFLTLDRQTPAPADGEDWRAAEPVSAQTCLAMARSRREAGDVDQALRWLTRVIDAGESFVDWRTAASRLNSYSAGRPPAWVRRRVRAWLCGTYTVAQLAPLLRLCALRQGIWLDLGEGGYDQHSQEILDDASPLYAHDPEVVIIATHADALALPALSETPAEVVSQETSRWVAQWRALSERGIRVVMHNFAEPADSALGHLAARLCGSREAMLAAINRGLGEAAGPGVSLVDCERLSGAVGKRRWFDPRYWRTSKLAVSLDAHPALARHTVAVLAAALGLSRKCVVVDLDNTLWGGVVGEDGVDRLRLGAGDPVGEAFCAFQGYLKDLKARGVLLAACSKNERRDAEDVFRKRPEMVLSLEDFAAFVANWEPKDRNIRRIAQTLNLGLDALAFVDDNPAERGLVRESLPEVEVVPMPADPCYFVQAVADSLLFEAASVTAEDAARTETYRANAAASALRESATTLEDYLRSLAMQAVVAPIEESSLPRAAQLIGKTNQFNLTGRRHSEARLRQLIAEPGSLHFTLRLRDRFADHGLVGLIIGRRSGEELEIDSFLLSCRVIGRNAEAVLLDALRRAAQAAGYPRLRGVFTPSARNAQVADLYPRFGFVQGPADAEATTWRFDLGEPEPWPAPAIAIESPAYQVTERA
jgi:FkbH-like protein